jgi:chromosome segregation ATPase
MITETPVADFQTPPRILIPKLVRSRDAWKAKAGQRKKERKALQIRVRDLIASRDRHRQRANSLKQDLEATRLQLEHTQQQLQQGRQQLHQVQQEREHLQARLDSAAAAGTAVVPACATSAAVDVQKKRTV